MPITPTCRFTETGVRLRVDDENAVIDLGDHPDYPRIYRATELAITYKTTETRNGDDVETTCEVTHITYVLDDSDNPVAYVSPDFLDRPEEWPAWVREQVEAHRPTNLVASAYDRAIAAVRSEYLRDETGHPEDEAYNQAINDAVVAIRDLKEN